MRSAFEIKQSPTGSYYFTFKSGDGRIQVISCSFPNRARLEGCIAKVREIAPFADICTNLHGKPPNFFIQFKEGGFVFSLIGFHMENIFSSIFYPNEEKCKEAIHSLKASAERAVIIDLTYE